MKAQCVRHTVGHCNEEWKETVFKSLCAPYQTHQPLLFFLYILKKNLNHILPIQFRGQISLLRLSIIPPHLYILLTHTHTHTHSLRRSGHALLLSLSLVLITRIVMSKQSTRPEQPPSISHNVKRRSLFGKDHDRRTSSGDPSDLSLDSFFKTHPRGFTFGLPTASSIQKRVDRKDITVTQHQRIPKTQTSSPAVIPKQLSHATHSATAMATTTKERTDPSQILKGVVAFLDTRTEDGDDVSENFEPALQSMGAKTRRTFSDSVTHLIFKKGSPATLRKALAKNVHIVNLLWVTRCKREGRRLEEKDFLIEHPQQIALTGTKRRKSMEPGKVKPLYDAEGSSINTDTGESKNNQKRKRALPSSTSSSLRNTKCQHQPQQRKPPRASTSSLQRSSKSASYTDHGEQKQQQQPQAKRYRSSSTMQGESGSVAIGGRQKHFSAAMKSKSRPIS